MRYFSRVKLLICVLCLALLLAACGSGLSGKWRSLSDSGAEIAFSSTGKMTLTSGQTQLTGTYTLAGNKITMNLTDPLGGTYVIEATFEVDGNKLMLTNDKGFTETFTK